MSRRLRSAVVAAVSIAAAVAGLSPVAPVGAAAPALSPYPLPAPPSNGIAHEVYAGDFAGDGRTDLLFYGTALGNDRLLVARDGGFEVRDFRVYGQFKVLVGNFGGSAKDDIAFVGRTRTSLWLSQGTGTFEKIDQPGTGSTNVRPLVGRFTPGSALDDIFLYGENVAPDVLWRSRADGTHVSQALTVSGNYQPLVGDFTDAGGAGLDEILWYSGAGSALWAPKGTGFVKSGVTIRSGYRPSVGQFAGDAHADVLWALPGAGGDSLWTSHGGAVPGFTSSYVRFDHEGELAVGDLDGDGWDDLFNTAGATPDEVWANRGAGDGRFAVITRPTTAQYRQPFTGNFVDDGTGPATDDVVILNRNKDTSTLVGSA